MDPYDSTQEKVSVLGPTLVFKGELTADEDLMLKGRVEGSITHTASLRIGAEGTVKGNIKAKNVTVDGTVDGDLHGGGSVVIRESAKVVGNVFSPRVTLVDGARFKGMIDMDVAETATTARKPGASAPAEGSAKADKPSTSAPAETATRAAANAK
jgi:cytoskeletal protein CcmA (bactofilin family)